MMEWYIQYIPLPSDHMHILNAVLQTKFLPIHAVSLCRRISVIQDVDRMSSMCFWLIIDGGKSVVSVFYSLVNCAEFLPEPVHLLWMSLSCPVNTAHHQSASAVQTAHWPSCLRERGGGEKDLWFCMVVANLCLFCHWGIWVIEVFRAYYCPSVVALIFGPFNSTHIYAFLWLSKVV